MRYSIQQKRTLTLEKLTEILKKDHRCVKPFENYSFASASTQEDFTNTKSVFFI
ncbi:hypothetical protein [Pedobacter cryoconitis]|uniref:hypothetical protein n=1 Tax=Pedobacter cryoconitis TaxID=188932 RepID=UPI000A5FBC2E|nr:hypothetical protein [Pedobacter cryoconitis]